MLTLKKTYLDQSKFLIFLGIIILNFVFSLAVSASTSDGLIPISTSSSTASLGYAWGVNLGWVNFGSAFSTVHITDAGLTGDAWTTNHGWINLNPSTIKVTNNGEGVLGGYAWGQNLGWINFTGVTIDANGEFHGYATLDQDGSKISFNCSNTTFNADSCSIFNFKLITDWRPLSVRSPVIISGGGGGVPFLQDGVIEPPHLEAYNAPLSILIKQSGNLTQDVLLGNVLLSVSANSILEPISFTVAEEPLTKANLDLIPADKDLLGSFYTVKAVNSRGELVTKFTNLLKITFPLPAGLTGVSGLKVLWIDEINNQPVEISNAVFNLKDRKVDFQVDHLTKFAVFREKSQSNQVSPKIKSLDNFINEIKDLFDFSVPVQFIKKPKPITKITPKLTPKPVKPESITVMPSIEPLSVIEKPSTPELPFNVTLNVINNNLENSQDLKVQIKFEEFDRKPTPLNLVFVIYDDQNKQLYSTQDNIIADNQEEYLKEFPDLNLSSGKYLLMVNTPDGLKLSGALKKDFEIIKKKQSFWKSQCLSQLSLKCAWRPISVGVIIMAIILILIKRKKMVN